MAKRNKDGQSLARVARAAQQWAAAQATADRVWASSSLQTLYIFVYSVFVLGVAIATMWSIAGGAIIVAVSIAIAVASSVGDQQLAIRTSVRKEYPTSLHCVVAYLMARMDDDEQVTLGDNAPIYNRLTPIIRKLAQWRATGLIQQSQTSH